MMTGPGEGVLAFEQPGGGSDHVAASKVAAALAEGKVPVVVLNACQSGAVGKDLEASVATALLKAGCAAVVAMGDSVYAVAAAEFMAAFYESLFTGATVGQAVSAGRRRLFEHDGRPSPKGDMPLSDWLRPRPLPAQENRAPGARRGDPLLGASHRAVREGEGGPVHQPGLVAPGRRTARRGGGAVPDRRAIAAGGRDGPHQSGGNPRGARRDGRRPRPLTARPPASSRISASPTPGSGTLLRAQLPDADLAALEERLADPETNPSARARLLFALCLVLDARGEYPRAAECARQANALNMELARGPRGYTPDLHVQYVESVMRGFTAELFEQLAGAGSDDLRPVFVFGLPRSGTTLVEQILASHSRIFGAGELKLARQSFDAIPSVLESPGPALDNISRLTPQAVGRLAEQHLHRLENLVQGHPAERIVDKMPDNYIYLGLLAAMFPRAVFIHCRRDLRDVALSCWTTDFRPENIPWASDPSYMGSRFEQYLRLMDHWRRVMPAPIHEVNYEDTVADLEGAARYLLAACGLEYEPGCLEFHRTQRRVKTASLGQVRQPIYARSVGRWRNYESELDDLFRAIPAGGFREHGDRHSVRSRSTVID